MSPYCPELVEDFETLAQDLVPDEDYTRELKEAATEIFEHLKQEGHRLDIRIGRTKIGGSVGKGTAIVYQDDNGHWIYPDLDLVVFVNDERPPFEELYEDFQELLEELHNITYIKVGTYSMRLKIMTPSYGEIKVDLLAAQNHVPVTQPYSGCDIIEIAALLATMSLNEVQRQSLEETSSVDQEEVKLNSSAFTEKTVRIVSNFVADDFIGDNVRLAKRWMRSIDLTGYGYVSARSCLSEMLAIKAQQVRKSKRNGVDRCLVSGFRRFLELMSRLSQLDISLDGSDPGLANYAKPIVRAPGNPWNNLAEGIPREAIRTLEKQANKTLRLLIEVRNQEGYNNRNANVIDEIFSHKW